MSLLTVQKRKVELVVTESMTEVGRLSLRVLDIFGRQHSFRLALEEAGFKAGEHVFLVAADEVTAVPINLEVEIEVLDCVCKE